MSAPLSTTAMRSAYSAYRCNTSKMVRVVFYGYSAGLLVASPTQAAWTAFSALMKAHDYPFKEMAGGTYSCRQIAGSSSYSLHAYGLAVDLNPSKNPHRSPLTTDIPKAFRADVDKIVTKSGRQVFQWGGEWAKPDAMHFQISATPDELATGLVFPGQPDPEEDTLLPMNKGDKSEDVRLLQRMLNRLDAGIDADGIYGPATVKAVKDILVTGDGTGEEVTSFHWNRLDYLVAVEAAKSVGGGGGGLSPHNHGKGTLKIDDLDDKTIVGRTGGAKAT